jgi:hypothetical protein
MAGPSRAIQVVPPGKPQSSLDVLSAANQVVRGIIAQAEAIVNKPTQDWDLDERKYSMEVLAKTAANAIASFNEWMQQDVFIAGAGRLVGCLDGVRRTAKHAAWPYSTSRITGRNHLKSGLEGLKAAFGDRCSLDTNALSLLGKGAPCNEIEATNNATCEAPKKPSLVIGPDERPYTVNDLMNLHGLSRQTVIRLYENEPGVQIIPALRSKTRGRRYRTLRVPRRVYVRMKNRMEVK